LGLEAILAPIKTMGDQIGVDLGRSENDLRSWDMDLRRVKMPYSYDYLLTRGTFQRGRKPERLQNAFCTLYTENSRLVKSGTT